MVRNCLLLAFALVLVGCAAGPRGAGGAKASAPGQSAAATSDDSREWRLQVLEQKFLQFQEDRLAGRTEIKRLKERVEYLDDRLGQTEDAQRDMDDSLHLAHDRVNQLADQVEKTHALAAEAREKADRRWEDIPKAEPKADSMAAAKPKPKPKAKAAKKAKPAMGRAIDPSYARGRDMVRSGKPVKGREALKAYLAASPRDTLKANAQYWIGESFYVANDYADSIVEFKKVYQKHPKHPKAAAALLKIGLAYRHLGDVSNARFYLQVLLDDHPKSEPTVLARKVLAAMPQ